MDEETKAAKPVDGIRILIVSKDELFARIAKTKLEGWGHSVHLESDEAAAAEWFLVDPIRLAIIDFDMPDGGGERLCRQLRESSRAGYVYLLCYGTGTDKERTMLALESGADSYTHKPLHSGELKLRLIHARRLLALDDAVFQGTGTDIVTGVISRAAFDRFLGVLYAQARRAGLTGILMFVEVVNQVDIFRRWGVHASHAVEQEVAGRLSGIHRSSDFVAKIADGRFCLLLTNTTMTQTQSVAQRVADALEELVVDVDGRQLTPRLTISTVGFPTDSLDAHEIIDHAPRITLAVVGGPEDPDDGYLARPI
jgi:diguanylate cyclase (GGDEF)-like protein